MSPFEDLQGEIASARNRGLDILEIEMSADVWEQVQAEAMAAGVKIADDNDWRSISFDGVLVRLNRADATIGVILKPPGVS